MAGFNHTPTPMAQPEAQDQHVDTRLMDVADQGHGGPGFPQGPNPPEPSWAPVIADFYPNGSTPLAISAAGQSSSVGVRPDKLELIGNALQLVESSFTLSSELIQRAQPLIQKNAPLRSCYWPSTVAPPPQQPIAIPVAEPTAAHSTPDPSQGYSQDFKAHLRNTVREVLLQEDLQSYGSRPSHRLKVSDTPFNCVTAAIAKEPQEFRATHLPANYDKGRNKDHFEGLVSDCIKEQKLILATFLKAGMTGKGLDKVPSLWSLIANIYSVFHPTFKKHGAKQIHLDKHTVRVCYIRFMVNLNRVNLRNKNESKQVSFWDNIDKDLASLRRKSPGYGTAYATMIYKIDKRLWDDVKTIRSHEPADQQPPSEEEIEARAQSILQARNAPEVKIELGPPTSIRSLLPLLLALSPSLHLSLSSNPYASSPQFII
ncbi:hypothetical protein PTTG_29624 [Puccinia triticina 1-1 BBBD Race 1]|uniref:Uncharacterized protein n=1 Tax=Puccinia triticina (isolate 1-1 / race 1 (BBBD)) TaxID=630390 RepID=A0A180G2Z1_PUCT1|nr:hypothetical protein PTTG_29624 [Puccinia triticina 1-1 BBBD Race 1]